VNFEMLVDEAVTALRKM